VAAAADRLDADHRERDFSAFSRAAHCRSGDAVS
jgi:hypothetical protein